jgi:predicted enzyme related to lactoylglutathione lyase
MIHGVHALIYTKDADQVRVFFRDTLKLPSVDVGHGWLIFALPPAELAVHPDEGETRHVLYLMCDDIDATIKDLARKGVEFTGPVTDARFGRMTAIKMPGGGQLGIYEPRHPTALGLFAGEAASSIKRKHARAKSQSPKVTKPARTRRKLAKRRKR